MCINTSIMLDIHIHYSDNEKQLEELKSILTLTIQKLDTIMANNEQLQAAIAELTAAVDAEQAQIAALLEVNAGVVVALQATIADLEAQVAAGTAPEQVQAAIDSLKAAQADLEGTVVDEPAPGE